MNWHILHILLTNEHGGKKMNKICKKNNIPIRNTKNTPYSMLGTPSVNPFPLTTNLQQTTLKISREKSMEFSISGSIFFKMSWKHCKSRNCLFWAIFPFVSMISKDVCCRGIRKRLYTMWERVNNFICYTSGSKE